MTTKMTLRALLLSTLFSACTFAGPITVNFTSSLLNGARGQTVTFSASLTNTPGSTVFLNGDSLNIAAPLTADDLKFLLNAPLSMASGVTTPTFQIFDVTIPSTAPFGIYPGTFSILGGSTPSNMDVVGTATFAVNVVPEPASMAITGLALMALISERLLRRKR